MEPLRGPPLDEDEWIAPDLPMPGAHEPGTSQQALQSPAPAGAADPSTFGRSSMQVIKGPHGASLTTSRAATGAAAGPSRDEGAAAPAAGLPPGSAAAERPSAVPPSSASKTGIEASDKGLPFISSLLTHIRTESEGTAAVAALTGAGSSTASSLSTPTIAKLLETPNATVSALLQHPYVRLPRQIERDCLNSALVDFRRKTPRPQGIRCAVPLLQEAHELLSHRDLSLTQVKQLLQVTSELMEHGAQYQSQDVSRHPTFRAVERLGTRFLLLDTVVSAFLVIGRRAADQDWRRVVDRIDDKAPPRPKRGNLSARGSFSFSLCQDLSNAIRTLKTGRRPDPAEIVRIKRMLFCLPFSPAHFKGKDFDPWRNDDNSGIDRL
ncbi:hypothetical protein EBH_0047820 [Eimeria brunetti]|uniref:Uncharacterized protein n=1 Tax=Eimeria brunetti TaxID=51314 RepID=U6LPY5_9EIME|nr:hypothetical protein EBH_0047820 [Eimeria brunetti]